VTGIGTWFRTDYDEPSVAAPVPVEVTSGMDPAVSILDQTVRGHAIVGRIVGDFGAVALKLRTDGRPLRVTAEIGLDDVGTWWWSDRVRPSPFTPERPRLLTVRAQGRVRGAVLLSRRQGPRRAAGATASLSFDLAEAELAGEGLFILEFGEAPNLDWAAAALCPRPAVGVRINRIELRERDGAAPTEGPADVTGCDFAVVQPGGPADFRLTTTGVLPAPPVPRNPRVRIMRPKPARAAFKVLRAARRVAVSTLPRPRGAVEDLRAVDLSTGAEVVVAAFGRGGHTEIRLSGPAAGPVLVGAALPLPTRSWRLEQIGNA
jgi:hypothetical protein